MKSKLIDFLAVLSIIFLLFGCNSKPIDKQLIGVWDGIEQIPVTDVDMSKMNVEFKVKGESLWFESIVYEYYAEDGYLYFREKEALIDEEFWWSLILEQTEDGLL